MTLLLFLEDLRSRTSYQLSPFAWLSRVTLKLKVTSWSTWLMLFLLVFALPQWFCFRFPRSSGQGIHSNFCQSRDLHVCSWNWSSRHGQRELCYFCLYIVVIAAILNSRLPLTCECNSPSLHYWGVNIFGNEGLKGNFDWELMGFV